MIWILFGVLYLVACPAAAFWGHRRGFADGWVCGHFHTHVPTVVAARALAHMKAQEGAPDA